MSSQSDELTMIQNAVLKPTNLSTFVDNNQTNIEANPEKSKLLTTPVSGYDFNKGINYSELFKSYTTTGFQATNFGRAIEEIELMLKARSESFDSDDFEEDLFIQRQSGCTIFLGYTSNMISSGIRDTIRFLVQHRLVDCLVTTAGGIEEDLIKCLSSTYIGDFHLSGRHLRTSGINRIGNLLVPNDNYCKFEDWVVPILDSALTEQKRDGQIWSPSKLCSRLGEEIANEESVLYWAFRNQIPVFCPALTDGSLGDMIYMHSFRSPGLIIDIAQDIRRINSIAVKAKKSGMIILGGGVIKHHIANANLMRNGADFSVFINTGQEFDGSDSGARPDEAISWGKIRIDSSPVKVYCDASLVFPIIVAETFAKYHHYSLSKKQI
ncbi:hypothetical protein RDWZM_002315 [Blomia tropicalis]|uniref:deoxyhypusine synthase n=1 Tax=Blomia tropicalis TaxID=40697 RepID=A0A9Q0MDA7_BLOTA|nr:hypothetical protein RDWZM_002315 [Blomia tropicalis]